MKPEAFTLAVCPVSAPEYTLALSVGETVCGKDFDVCLTCENGVFQPVLTAHTTVPLTELRLELALPGMPFDDDLYFYSNVSFTNDIAYVRRWKETPSVSAWDMFLLKNKASSALFAAGKVTSHRFYT